MKPKDMPNMVSGGLMRSHHKLWFDKIVLLVRKGVELLLILSDRRRRICVRRERDLVGGAAGDDDVTTEGRMRGDSCGSSAI